MIKKTDILSDDDGVDGDDRRASGDQSSTPYEVGYGRPPKATRFKPGQSGNPKGGPLVPTPDNHHRAGTSIVMPTIASVDVDALRIDAADTYRLINRRRERMAIIRIALEGFGGQHETFPVHGCDSDLAAELVGRAGFAFRDSDHLGCMQQIELVAVLRPLRQQPLDRPEQPGEPGLQFILACDFATDAGHFRVFLFRAD